MKQPSGNHVACSGVMEQIMQEYAQLLKNDPISLEKILLPADFRLNGFYTNFSPHPAIEKVKKEAALFGQSYNIWLDNSKHSVSCASYLYPQANYDRMLNITNLLTVGFYLNDIMGRDVFKLLSEEEQKSSRKLVNNMASVDRNVCIMPGCHPLESANAAVLRTMRDSSPKEWFDKFLDAYRYHLDITHRDRNTDAIGYIPGVHEYIDIRCHYAAVHHLILLIEYSNAQFLEWDAFFQTGFSQKLQRLHWIIAAFPALLNDLFSFENEVIDNGCDSNLVVILMLNNPGISLAESIEQSSRIVKDLVIEISVLINYFEAEACAVPSVRGNTNNKLTTHLQDIIQFVKASWLWQRNSKRYKRAASIWSETNLLAETVAK